MKIIIIGAGLSGLTTEKKIKKYVAPQLLAAGDDDDDDDKQALEIKIYDEYEVKPSGVVEYSWRDHSDIRNQRHQQGKPRNQGAAISLQSNAFKVLRELDRDLADRVYAEGLPCKGFTWKSQGDWVLGREDLEAHLISRPALVGCLLEALSSRGIEVVYRSVKGVEFGEGRRPVVRFFDEDEGEDGDGEVADLVVGADGIRSVLRKSLLGDGEGVRPKYLGNCAVGGILDLPQTNPLPSTFSNSDHRITFTHGPTGTFGYGGLSQTSPNKLIFFSFYDTSLPARGSKPDPSQVTSALRERHKGWADPMIAQCLAQTEAIDTVYPIFYMPDLTSWGRDGCVLVGDAAHAMTPATGQGGSQACEDGLVLGLLLGSFLGAGGGGGGGKNRDVVIGAAVEESIRGLYAVRAEHVYAIKRAGLAIKEPTRPWGWGTTLAVYGFYFVMTKVKWIRGLFGEAIYPAHRFDARGEVERYVAGRVE